MGDLSKRVGWTAAIFFAPPGEGGSGPRVLVQAE